MERKRNKMSNKVFTLEEVYSNTNENINYFSVEVFGTFDKAFQNMLEVIEEHRGNIVIVKEIQFEDGAILVDDSEGIYNFSIKEKTIL